MTLDAYACSLLLEEPRTDRASRLIDGLPPALVAAWAHRSLGEPPVTSRSHDSEVYIGIPSGLITTIRIDRCGAHDYVRVWNRGGLAGELTLVAGDGDTFAEWLGLQPARRESSP